MKLLFMRSVMLANLVYCPVPDVSTKTHLSAQAHARVKASHGPAPFPTLSCFQAVIMSSEGKLDEHSKSCDYVQRPSKRL
jgi:hypothetical protein